ncbi:MAG: glycosyltransferase [Rhodocyclaceae bacterium]|nr:glycosyltransferase [Rhodocyclaceae bacterium]
MSPPGRPKETCAPLWGVASRVGERGGPFPHRFIVVIPVADRPQHIRACLASLLELQRRYPYAGEISVLIADDSNDPDNIDDTRALAEHYSALGIPTMHFPPAEQADLVAALNADIPRIVGNAPREKFSHKGQGVMRNIAYLKVAEMLQDMPNDNVLIWSIDSDQEFQVKIVTPEGDRNVYAVDFFHALDAIFSRTDALVLTGKVVGDPPVSPAVMTANFLEDVIGFLEQMHGVDPASACGHHQAETHRQGEAAYHDMADLFGFKSTAVTYQYRCTLDGTHTEAGCFAHFAARLNSFFYGEHPTRVSYYLPDDALASVQPARTVYAGNYVFRPAALKYFIPFAALRLRMSGPTLGRIVKSAIGPRFVSANLPMLHKRTVESGGQSEFRPGIETQEQVIDMSGEFERQFYGDVMLFSTEKLAGECRLASADFVASTLDAVRAEMLEKYNTRQRGILDRLATLEALLHDAGQWWNRSAEHAAAVADFAAFAANVQRNFAADSAGHVRINSPESWGQWRTRLLEAIASYPADRAAWERVLCRT